MSTCWVAGTTGITDAILQLIDDCTADLDTIEREYMYVQIACLDFSKAFDKLKA